MAGEIERLAALAAAREAVAAARAAALDNSRPAAERLLAQDVLVARVAQLLDLQAQDPAVLAAEAAEAEALQKAQEWVPQQKELIARREALRGVVANPTSTPAEVALAEIDLAALPRAG